jgi:membrane protease YdiL (CAAX protease family)
LYHGAAVSPALGGKLTVLGIVTIYVVQLALGALGVPGLVSSATSDLVVITGLLLFVRKRGGQQVLGLRRAALVFTLAAVLIGIAAWYLNLSLVELLSVPQNEHTQREVEKMVTQTPLFPTLVAMALLPAIAEELLFRGVLLRSLATLLHPAAAIAISAAVFALYHLQLGQMVTTFMLGLALGLLTLRARSVVPAMFVHLINNSIAVMISRDDIPSVTRWIANHPAIMVVGCIVSVGCGVAITAKGRG